MIKRLTFILIITFTTVAFSQHAASGTREAGNATREDADPHTSTPSSAHTTIDYNHPTLPPFTATWAGAMLIIIAGMFLAAAVIGPVIRSEMPEEVPDAHSHDEPPGASGHHGISGTHAPTPDHHH